MGFFSFFKKRKKSIELEKIKFKDISEIIKKNKNKEKENEFSQQIKEKISLFIKELEERTTILEKIDLKEKKAEERAKFIIQENLTHYIRHLRKLIENLQEIDESNPKSLIGIINSNLYGFEKKSHMNFQKATFLIGKELGDVKNTLNLFFKDLKNIVNENKDLLENSKTIYLVEKKLENINEFEKIEKQIQEKINKVNKDIKNLESKKSDLKKDIDEIKKSKEYLNEIEKQKNIKLKKDKLSEEIYELKQSIDFKYLASIFHSNQKDMEIIKQYKEDFQNSFAKDNGEKIINLLRESRMDITQIIDKLEPINVIQKNIKELTDSLDKKPLKNISEKELQITKINVDIESLTQEKTREEKRFEKSKQNKKEILNNIKEELNKINIILEEDD